jgi:prepilin-type N-terminal cleavage/methylation domain-containing protein
MPSPCSAISPRTSRLDQRGLTLMEVTIVVVLASLVMLALLGFYINSQATWNDASTQAISQREMTIVIERMTEKAHRAHHAIVSTGPPLQLDLYDQGSTNPFYTLVWNTTDSLLYESGTGIGGGPHPILSSEVANFQISCVDSMLTLSNLTLRTASGKYVSAASTMTLMNWQR